MQMNLAGAKRADGKPWTWQHVFPPPGAPPPRGAPPPAAPPRAATSKVDVLKVFRLWKTGKPQG